MTDDRARGVVLYSLAGVVLLAGGVWFFGVAPETGESPQVVAWRATVERVLPDLPSQQAAETMVVSGQRERTVPVDGGSYLLSMACAGVGGQVWVQLNSGTNAGRAVPCGGQDPSVTRFEMALADEFRMWLSTESDTGGVVLRWRLERSPGF